MGLVSGGGGLSRYGGAIVQHCHFLYHEDLGMMGRFWATLTGTTCTASKNGGSTFTCAREALPSASPHRRRERRPPVTRTLGGRRALCAAPMLFGVGERVAWG